MGAMIIRVYSATLPGPPIQSQWLKTYNWHISRTTPYDIGMVGPKIHSKSKTMKMMYSL